MSGLRSDNLELHVLAGKCALRFNEWRVRERIMSAPDPWA